MLKLDYRAEILKLIKAYPGVSSAGLRGQLDVIVRSRSWLAKWLNPDGFFYVFFGHANVGEITSALDRLEDEEHLIVGKDADYIPEGHRRPRKHYWPVGTTLALLLLAAGLLVVPTPGHAGDGSHFLVQTTSRYVAPELQTITMQLSSEEDVAVVDVTVNGHSLREAKRYLADRDREIGSGPKFEQAPQLVMPAGIPTTPFCGGPCISFMIGQRQRQFAAMQQVVAARNAKRQQDYVAKLAAFNAAHASGFRAVQIWAGDMLLPFHFTFGDQAQITVHTNVLQVKIGVACDPYTKDFDAPQCNESVYSFGGME